MTTFESPTTTVATTPDDLFAYLTTIDTITDWYDDWDETTHDGQGQTLEVGTGFSLTSQPAH